VVDGFRSRLIPFDNIVQDWFYWPESAWGSHRFDPARFPDPDGRVRAIHDRHARLMISVWGKFYPGSENFEAMRSKWYLYETTLRSGFKDWVGPGYPYAFFDAFNPEARKLFWAPGRGEKPADPVTLFVYAGADGAFTLYEDDGLTYGYEKGAFSRIPIRWNDATGTLAIGKREGAFPGMLAQRTFEVVLVAKGKPVGFSFEPKPDRSVRYEGAQVEIRSLSRSR